MLECSMDKWVKIDTKTVGDSRDYSLEQFCHSLAECFSSESEFSPHSKETRNEFPPGMYLNGGEGRLILSVEEGIVSLPNSKESLNLLNILRYFENYITVTTMKRYFKLGESNIAYTFLGMMMRGLAHEINNPLGIMASYVQYLQLVEDDGEKKEILGNMLTSVFRASDIVKRISAFGRVNSEKETFTLNNELEKYLNFFEQIRKYRFPGIKIEKEIPDQFFVFANSYEVQEGLFAVLMNACEAYSGDGTVELSLKDTSRVYISIVVKDFAGGVDEENLPKLKLPFFTTKGENEGRGLGLTIAEYLINKNGGTLDVSSTGEGMEVEIRLLRVKNENTNG